MWIVSSMLKSHMKVTLGGQQYDKLSNQEMNGRETNEEKEGRREGKEKKGRRERKGEIHKVHLLTKYKPHLPTSAVKKQETHN